MIKPVYDHKCEKRYPHADDMLERQHADNGFSSGWAMHQKPVPEYFFDSHIHYCGPKDNKIQERIRTCMKQWETMDTPRELVILNIYGDNRDNAVPAYASEDYWFYSNMPWITIEDVKEYLGDLPEEGRFYWSAWLDHREPTPKLIHSAAKAGAVSIKLHNAPVIELGEPHSIWLSNDWQDVFRAIDERGLPVLFHVTQRLPSSDYTGGGRNTYWENGWKNGVTYSNENLLETFLTCCRRYPDIDFIGAHQLHIGWERLDELFTKLPNLYVDTTVGCMLHLYDDFYDHDKEYLRAIFIKWADRIIFGTDSLWCGSDQNSSNMVLLKHQRFITSLDLPGDVLTKICHGNVERLHRLKPL